jgi:Rod binding domain-containing protein
MYVAGISAPAAQPLQVKSRQAAQDFESLLLTQLLRAARQGDGWLDGGSDAAAAPALEFAEEHLAAALSAQGGLGLSRLIAGLLPEPGEPSVTPHVPGGRGR